MFLYWSSDGSNDINFDVLLLGDSLGYTDGKVIGSDEGIKLGLFDDKLLGTTYKNVDGITFGIYFGTELGY